MQFYSEMYNKEKKKSSPSLIINKSRVEMRKYMNIIRIEIRKNKNRCFLVTALTLIIFLIIAFVNLKQYIYDYQIGVWEKAGEFLDLLFPLLCMICVGEMVYEDKKNNFITYIGNRIRIKKYLQYKKVSYMLSASFFIFVVSALGFFITQYIYPKVGYISYNTINFRHVWNDCYINEPIVYAFVLSFWRSIIAIVIINLGFELSKYITNKVIIIITPFVMTIFMHFAFAILNFPQYSIIYSFDPSTLSYEAISLLSIMTGPFIFILLSFGVTIFGEVYEKYFCHC